ncbi:type IX secretion system membrane protein PorP/SprF [Galbibacter sp. PAP.153]|uniref:PorP/SprF family type IX secretion system membrane protein n=1 Tax=Galbibacter sp. PAP.153 TaxID=3104623 RepID=UPI00300A5D3E
MQKLRNIVFGILCIVSSCIYAQQEEIITNYRYQINLFNPAYTGVNGQTLIKSSIRQQWTDIKDAPTLQTVSFSTSVGEKIGLGVTVINSNTFVESETFTSIDFSYRLKLKDQLDLYLGLKAGGDFYSVNTEGLETYNVMADPSIASISNFNPNIGVGLLIKGNNWYASLSIPRLLSTERSENEDGILTSASSRPHMYGSVGYDFLLNDVTNLKLKPSIMTRYVAGAPISLDVNTMISFNEVFEIGAMYRTDRAYAGLANFKIAKHFTVGYAYEMSTREELANSGNTNEFLLMFQF